MSAMLTLDERIRLSSLMLAGTLEALAGAQSLKQILVVSSDRRAEEITSRHGAKFLHEEKETGVNSAVAVADDYCLKEDVDATVVIPQDLPLLDSADISMACNLAENDDKCIVICPSFRYDGTNLLLRKPPAVIKTYYDNDSYKAHITSARELGIPVKLFFSKKLMADMDTPEDAKELARENGTGKTLEFLRSKAGIY
jgi:2-phospho-L-lactate guanylyltransferase